MRCKNIGGLQMSIGVEREEELKRRKGRKKLTIPQLRQELTDYDIGYMSNWTKPVLIRRLEENDKWLDYQANQRDAFTSFKDQKEELENTSKELLSQIEEITETRNSVVRQRAIVLEKIKKIDAVIEMTEPTF